MGNNRCRYVGRVTNVGYPSVSVSVPGVVRKAMDLKGRGRVLVTLELLGEDFAYSGSKT